MPLQNKKRLAYLGALTLLFSYAEMMLPRFVPFFRLGLGNIAILLALDLDFPSLLILTVIKSVTSSMIGGTLFSPFFIVSICQSIISGILMFLLFKIKKNWLSIYGISLAGSAISAVIQILLSSLYLGWETLNLLGPMLIFSIFAAVITAFLSQALKIPMQAPELIRNENVSVKQPTVFIIFSILISAVLCLMMDNLVVLCISLILAFLFQLSSGRKIYFLPHISLWLFIILVSLFSPNGKILFEAGKITITEGALLIGIEKSLKLSIASALSQCAASLKPQAESMTALTLSYFSGLCDKFRFSEGNLIKRLQTTLAASQLTEGPDSQKKVFFPFSILMIVIYIGLFIFDLKFI